MTEKRPYRTPVAIDVSGRSASAQIRGLCQNGTSLVSGVSCRPLGVDPTYEGICEPNGYKPLVGGCEQGYGAYNSCLSGSNF